jgi:hypothetical protein
MSSEFFIFDPSQSSVPEILTETEQKEAQDYLYSDIPHHLRETFDENNKKWISHAPQDDTWSSELGDCLIVGVNAKYTVAFKSFASPDLIFRRKNQMQQVETGQFANAWTSTLLRCNNQLQYEEVNKKFMSLVKYDPTLRDSAVNVLKNQELIEFKNSLPKTTESGGIKTGTVERKLWEFVYKPTQVEEIKPFLGKSNKVKVELFVFSKKWRESKIQIYCLKDTVPSGKLSNDKVLLIAYYVEPNTVCVQKINLKTDTVTKTRYFKTNGENSSPLIIASYGLISDGLFVYHQKYQLHIDSAFITSLFLDDSFLLYIGTNFGGIYRVNMKKYELESFDMTKDVLFVLKVGKNIAQSIYAVTYFDEADDITFNIERPVSSIKKGAFIISFDKYGVIRFTMSVRRKGEIQINPPKEFRINSEDLQPWYEGLYMNDEGDLLKVVYPDGKIRSLKLK